MNGGGPELASGKHLPFGGSNAEPHAGIVQAKSPGNLRRIAGKPEHIFLRIVVHLAVRLHVVVQFDDASFGLRQHVAEFVQRPGEIVAVIVERNIGILAGVESAVGLIGQNFIDPGDDAFGGFCAKRDSG